MTAPCFLFFGGCSRICQIIQIAPHSANRFAITRTHCFPNPPSINHKACFRHLWTYPKLKRKPHSRQGKGLCPLTTGGRPSRLSSSSCSRSNSAHSEIDHGLPGMEIVGVRSPSSICRSIRRNLGTRQQAHKEEATSRQRWRASIFFLESRRLCFCSHDKRRRTMTSLANNFLLWPRICGNKNQETTKINHQQFHKRQLFLSDLPPRQYSSKARSP